MGSRCEPDKRSAIRQSYRSVATAAAAVTFTATAAAAFAAVLVTMVVTVAVTTAATVMTVVMIVVVTVRTVNVAVSQFFFGRFADSNNFYVEFQILASQHVVTVNHNVVVFHFGNFYRYWTTGQFQPGKRMPTCSSSTPMKTSLGTRCTGFSSY